MNSLEKAVELQRAGKFSEAETAFQSATDCAPGNALAWASYGLFLAQARRYKEALPSLRRSVELGPERGAYWLNYGNALRKVGETDRAIVAFEEAIKRDADQSIARNCLGEAWQAKGKLDLAEVEFRAAIAANPRYGSAFGNLGITLSRMGKLAAAVEALDTAIGLEPQNARHYASKGALLRDACQAEEALVEFAKALELEPNNLANISKYLYTLNFAPSLTEQAIADEHRRWGSAFGKAPRRRSVVETEQPITIGFLSGDFSSHSVAFFLIPLYESIDRTRFRICSISETDTQDRVTERFRELSDSWIDTRGRSTEAVSEMIGTQRVDVLIDLAGHTAGSRLDALAAAQAPLKLSWLGYPNRVGIAGVDGRIVDHLTDPSSDSEGQLGERLLRIRDCFLSYRPYPEAPPVAELPCLRSKRVTFGSFNNAAKINDAVVALWAGVLTAMPESRLTLKSWQYDDDRLVERLRAAFQGCGVGRERVEFRGRLQGYVEHLALYNEVDIALDTFPYNGTTTTCEAMCMGVPTLTLAGDRHAARVGVSLLSHAGLPQWVARSEEEFVAKAVEFASDRAALAKLRSELRHRLTASTLGNSEDFARRFERLVAEELGKLGGQRSMDDWIERISIGGEVTGGAAGYEPACAELPTRLDGARVLDASCVDGFWAVEALKRGAASVVSLPAEGYSSFDDAGNLEIPRREHFEWCRRKLQIEEERMQLFEGLVYNVAPGNVGEFDWVLLTVNVNKLRHVTFALDALRSVCKSQLLLNMRLAKGNEEEPSVTVREGPYWLPSQAGLVELLRISGFELEGITVYPLDDVEAEAIIVAQPIEES